MSSVFNILKCVIQIHRFAQELKFIAKQFTAEAQLAQDAQAR